MDKKKEEMQDTKNGAWGPIYKNREHFINMHIC